ncbi:hypothetical protein [Bdellovibrio svalbardensis]|uniref:Outer membrane protein beta-barrel domain-containing protein n=1 Tax=Bdellovibrio svalbardensis TaxID=2972972 RepID=A0ABT6DFK9_9BACT|nr:hypothetical protein [Bdellovibrio svalbardensis]MDG0815578.1 hypothetical protein [Bdellovibrio svalbardensis]
MSFKRLLPLALIFLSASAEARIFDLGRENIAAYFGFTGGTSAVGQSAFENEAGSSVTISNEVKYNYSGEFGVVYSTPIASVRFGFEFLKPQSLENLVGKNATTDLYTETSDILGYIPKITFDINLRKTADSRSFISATAGYATVTLKNSYTLTAAGQAAYPGMDDKMEAKGTGILYGASLGHESFLTDTTTMLFEFGYRKLNIEDLKYTRSGSYFGTAHNDGDAVLNNGSQRNIDLSGMFLGLSFRFYM